MSKIYEKYFFKYIKFLTLYPVKGGGGNIYFKYTKILQNFLQGFNNNNCLDVYNNLYFY